jgi:hypothetical protein
MCVATKVPNFQYIKRAAIFWNVSQILRFSNLITKAYQAYQICGCTYDMSHKYMSSYSGSVIQNITFSWRIFHNILFSLPSIITQNFNTPTLNGISDDTTTLHCCNVVQFITGGESKNKKDE